jgi:hypothetical protein
LKSGALIIIHGRDLMENVITAKGRGNANGVKGVAVNVAQIV